MWSLVTCMLANPGEVESYLRDDYEPFAITNEISGDRLWLRKKISTHKATVKEVSNAVHNKPARNKQRKSTGRTVQQQG